MATTLEAHDKLIRESFEGSYPAIQFHGEYSPEKQLPVAIAGRPKAKPSGFLSTDRKGGRPFCRFWWTWVEARSCSDRPKVSQNSCES
ncbi:MAG: hypothetical protein PS018_23620 [bacterium]|nr:hypothetical protein [bacterium]